MNGNTGFEMAAMWNLSGNDIKKAKDQLEARRATLKAEYEEEMKRIDAELTDIDTVERVAVNFVSKGKGEPGSAKTEAEPEKDMPSSFGGAADTKGSSDSEKAENNADSHDKPSNGTSEQKGSRWRMRLGTVSDTEAAD